MENNIILNKNNITIESNTNRLVIKRTTITIQDMLQKQITLK